MTIRYRIFSIAFICGLFLWLADALLHFLLYYKGSFGDLLIFQVPPYEFYIRLTVIALFLAFGLFTSKMLTEYRQGLEALRESEENFKTIFDSAVDGILIAEMETKKFHTGNKAICRLLGYSLEEIEKLGVADIHPEADLPRVVEQVEKQMRGEVILGENIPLLRKDGGVLYADVNSSPIEISGKACLMGVFRDITERRRAEEALRESDDRYRTVVENSFEAISVINGEGRLYANPAYLELTGYTWEELKDVVPWSLIAPECRQEALERGMKRLNGKEVPKQYEITLIHKNGERIFAEATAGVVHIGGKAAILNSLRDATKRKRAEEALKEANNIINRSPAVAFLRKNEEGWPVEFVSENVEALFGYAADEFTSSRLSYAETIHPKDLDRIAEAVRSHSGGEGKDSFSHIPYRIVTKNGAVKWIEDRTHIRRDEKGLITHYQGIVWDVTEQKNAEEQLLRAGKMEAVGQLAAGIAHEINTPTQYIQVNTEFLEEAFQKLAAATEGDVPKEQEKDRLIEEIKETIDGTKHGISRIVKIIESMRYFGHPGSHEKTRTDVNEAIEQAVTLSHSEWKYHSEVATDLDPALPPLMVYFSEFNQVLLNLIINAAQAIAEKIGETPEQKGLITLASRFVDDRIEVRVSDTGPGISGEVLPRIFEPFFTTKEVGRGTGQGLSLVRNVIELRHGGEIEVETEPGGGTTFILRLPVEPEDETSRQPTEPRRKPGG